MMMRTRVGPWAQAVRGLGLGLIAALAFSFALNLLMLAVPLYSMQLYDRVLGSGSIETLILLSLMTAAALAAFGAFEMVRTCLLARLASRFEAVLTRPTVEQTAQLGGSGALGLRDLAQVRQALTGPAMAALFDAPWLPLALIAVWLLHPLLALFTGVSALCLASLAVANDRVARTPQRRASSSQLEAQILTDELARKAEAVRAMGMIDAMARRIGRLHGTALAGQQLAAERGGIVMGMTRAMRLAVQAGAMGLGAWLVLSQELTPGALLASSILVSKALAPVEQMVGTWKTVMVARESWGRLQRLLATVGTEPVPMPLPTPSGRLSVEAAGVRAIDGRPLLHNVSFTLEAGECLAVVGPSGAGKSTLARLLTGVRAPDAGTVRLDGAQLDHHAPGELGRHIGYLPQDTMLFAGTVAENIARMALQPDAAAVVEAARLAGAHDMIQRLGKGYETMLGDGGTPLSGGQRQRIGLARALYGLPCLVVLDEPNANLDGEGEAALMATLARLAEAGVTAVLITHRPQVLQRADKILVLDGGTMKSFGPRDAVLASLFRRAQAA
ncbi:MAG TPA: type I secretion system permease/ATPase [Azospirillum sp.]|nr:type I secretion system permease/ATPase [Azospirillum sp.]